MKNAQLVLKLKEYIKDLEQHLKDMKKAERIQACLVLGELKEKIQILINEV